MVAPCPPLETVGLADLFLGRPRSRRYPKFNIRRDIPRMEQLRQRIEHGQLHGKATIGVRVGKVLNKYKVGKHFKLGYS